MYLGYDLGYYIFFCLDFQTGKTSFKGNWQLKNIYGFIMIYHHVTQDFILNLIYRFENFDYCNFYYNFHHYNFIHD